MDVGGERVLRVTNSAVKAYISSDYNISHCVSRQQPATTCNCVSVANANESDNHKHSPPDSLALCVMYMLMYFYLRIM